jgi:malonyl-CoA O-methyltransferase
VWSRQHFLCADVELLPLAGASMDLIFSSLTFQWCNDPYRVFSGAKRILKPDRPFIFATLGPGTLNELRSSWARVDDRAHVNAFLDMHDIGDALVRAGLEGVVMDVEAVTLHYSSCRELMNSIKSVGAHNVHDLRPRGLTGKAALRQMTESYEQYRCREGLPATYEIVYGHAWSPHQDRIARQPDGTSYVPVSSIRRHRDTR